ncbi:probable serine/threonine-protein kinase kinX isoform X2 [Wyeomyia smithii]|uniref:probable serine/threonine-protein kinase kinX isoform X2 n=1 Tax=Wyeomyia smithii TaxID=174621 RepID=UPI002467C6D8|nr:probable serine/threonine-protein kinase kinX isoform X2 [Wyeomyia smithii]
MARLSVWVLLGLAVFTLSVNDFRVNAEIPTEYECRPYIEKALQDLKTESVEIPSSKEEEVTIDEPSSTESPIDVTSQEEEDNTAAEETSIEEDIPASPEELTPSEEVQEALFDNEQPEEISQEIEQDIEDETDNGEEPEEEKGYEENGSEENIEEDAEQTEALTDSNEEEANAEAEDEDDDTVSAEDNNEEVITDSQETNGDEEDTEDENDEETTDSQEAYADEDEEFETDSQEVEDGANGNENDQTYDGTAESQENMFDNDEEINDDDKQENLEKPTASEEITDEIENNDDEEAYSVEHPDDEKPSDSQETPNASEEADDAEQENENEDLSIEDTDNNEEADNGEDEEVDDDDEKGAGQEAEKSEDIENDDAADDDLEEEESDQAEASEDVQESAEVVSEGELGNENVETVEAVASQEEENEKQASEELSEDTSIETADELESAPLGEVANALDEDVSTIMSEEETESVDGTITTESEEVEVTPEIKTTAEEVVEEVVEKVEDQVEETAPVPAEEQKEQQESVEESEPLPEEDLLLEYEIPTNLRDTSHIYELLNINEKAADKEKALNRVADVILRDLKKIYDTAIKPLETLYKYRDLSNRHFGDPEIFSKPLILFMGPWSGGKSTILNYLTQNEYTLNSVRTGAEPSPAYFNILMHGDEPEVLDGTQLAADWTFSGLQKFGQGLLDRLRGQKLPNKLLERVNIVEIPGILEVRKQVSQYFPFNDACQWFIDRADIIFLVYDPSKLDVGPETEAILDQLKGRECQTRILLNKADQVKPEELLRVQGALIWNISPLMSSAQPPVMYTVSLWSNPFETGAPIRLLQAQERFMLLDLSQAIEKRIENKIASARRFAVRVRNHAKMVDCYLTTYYNHKTLFANKKYISDQIIGNPQQYHIYEGLSTLTNISRYDLPDPEVYRDFFHLNPLYEFKKLSETCTYFRGCPINKLDIAIAYDLPELVGKYKKMSEAALDKLDVPSPTTGFVRSKTRS